MFLPRESEARRRVQDICERVIVEEGQRFLGWRDVPTDDSRLGPSAVAVEPIFKQLIVGWSEANERERVSARERSGDGGGPASERVGGSAGAKPPGLDFERKLFVIRKRIEHAVDRLAAADKKDFYIVSLSSKTLIYKGMLTADQIESMFPDLADADVESALALVHQRFSTNTFPSWPLAHPYRLVAHNGEINTLRGNINWMKAREALCQLGRPRRRPEEDPAHHPRRRERHRDLRQRARVARDVGSVAAARDPDDDSRAVAGDTRR